MPCHAMWQVVFVCLDSHTAVGEPALLPAVQDDRTHEQLHIKVPGGQGTSSVLTRHFWHFCFNT